MKLTPKFNSTDEIWLRFRQAKLQNSHCQRHIYVCVCCFRFAFSLQVCAATQNYSFNVVAKSFRNTAIFCHTVRGSRISEQVHGMFVFCMFDSFFFWFSNVLLTYCFHCFGCHFTPCTNVSNKCKVKCFFRHFMWTMEHFFYFTPKFMHFLINRFSSIAQSIYIINIKWLPHQHHISGFFPLGIHLFLCSIWCTQKSTVWS